MVSVNTVVDDITNIKALLYEERRLKCRHDCTVISEQGLITSHQIPTNSLEELGINWG